jgi:hypothetical protein
MNKTVIIIFVFVLMNFPCSLHANAEHARTIDDIKNTVFDDYRNYYSGENMGRLAIGFGVAGLVANTPTDKEIQDWYNESLKSSRTDDISGIVKEFGNYMIAVPVYFGVAFIGEFTKDNKLGAVSGEWGRKSLRAVLVGEPPMLFAQRVLGSSRPKEDYSRWHPFKDNNGVSGHSFIGAIPFLTAAGMTHNPYLRSIFYLGSTLTGLSRINDNDHYFSQAALGWWMGYLAVKSVEKTEKQKIIITPTVIHSSPGIMITGHF